LRHFRQPPLRAAFQESGCLGMQPKMGGKFHLKLNMGTRPIAHKYCEGKMKSTLKRESKARETVKREPIEASSAWGVISRRPGPCACVHSASVARAQRLRAAVHLRPAAGQHGLPGPEAGVGKVTAHGRRYSPASWWSGRPRIPLRGDSARLRAGLARGMRLTAAADYV